MWRWWRFIAALALGCAAAGCGATGWIRFQEIDPGAETIHQTPTRVYAIDCQDQELEMVYRLSCTRDGGAIPWKVLGVFHAGNAARTSWDRYSREVVEKAERRSCPAVLVRRAPPAASSWAEAVGALCVDTEQPSGVSGPLRLVSVRTGPLHVLADGEAVTLAAR